MDINSVIQSIIAMLVITWPPDPAKILLFNSLVDGQEKPNRVGSGLKVALVALIVLSISALGGEQIANLFGIDLNAFSTVGGIVVALMGFEMLYGGKPSRTQGHADSPSNQEDESAGLIMPLGIPLIAGPGAIVTTVSISTTQTDGMFVALIGAACVASAVFISLVWLGGLLAKLPASATALMLRLGGLLLATIGIQMLLGGLKAFFAE